MIFLNLRIRFLADVFIQADFRKQQKQDGIHQIKLTTKGDLRINISTNREDKSSETWRDHLFPKPSPRSHSQPDSVFLQIFLTTLIFVRRQKKQQKKPHMIRNVCKPDPKHPDASRSGYSKNTSGPEWRIVQQQQHEAESRWHKLCRSSWLFTGRDDDDDDDGASPQHAVADASVVTTLTRSRKVGDVSAQRSDLIASK